MIEAVQFQQILVPAPKHRKMRPVDLVEGEQVIIGAARLHIDCAVRRIGDGIDAEPGPMGVDQRRNLGNGIDRAQDVGAMRDADQPGFRRHQDFEIGQADVERRWIERPGLEDDAALAQDQPWPDIGFVIEISEDDFIARLQLAGHGGRQKPHQNRCGRAKHDLFRAGGIDETRYFSARQAHPAAGQFRYGIAGTGLDAAGQEVIGDAAGDATQHLRSAGIVEIGPVVPGQRRKLRAHACEIEGGGGWSNHGMVSGSVARGWTRSGGSTGWTSQSPGPSVSHIIMAKVPACSSETIGRCQMPGA